MSTKTKYSSDVTGGLNNKNGNIPNSNAHTLKLKNNALYDLLSA
jgi:hypothetical protein